MAATVDRRQGKSERVAERLQEYREDVLGHRIQCGDLSNRREVQKLLDKAGRVDRFRKRYAKVTPAEATETTDK